MISKIRKISSFLIAAALCAAWVIGHAAETAKPGKETLAQADLKQIEGQWVRPDGGYVLELGSLKKNGSVSAAYFNPRPIRVYRAEAAKKNGRIFLYIELRDINYPGSNYNLQYDPETDRLTGKYFQAVTKQNFNIFFVRAR